MIPMTYFQMVQNKRKKPQIYTHAYTIHIDKANMTKL